MTFLSRHYFLFGLSLLASLVFADDAAIGKIKTLSGGVSIERNGSSLMAKMGDSIYAKDHIVTGKDGSVGLLFNDDSRLSVGPDSNMAMEDFSFDPATNDGHLNVGVKRGSLSVIAGKMVEKTPGSLKVKTPTAILAVRGTEFSIKVDDSEARKAAGNAQSN